MLNIDDVVSCDKYVLREHDSWWCFYDVNDDYDVVVYNVDDDYDIVVYDVDDDYDVVAYDVDDDYNVIL